MLLTPSVIAKGRGCCRRRRHCRPSLGRGQRLPAQEGHSQAKGQLKVPWGRLHSGAAASHAADGGADRQGGCHAPVNVAKPAQTGLRVSGGWGQGWGAGRWGWGYGSFRLASGSVSSILRGGEEQTMLGVNEHAPVLMRLRHHSAGQACHHQAASAWAWRSGWCQALPRCSRCCQPATHRWCCARAALAGGIMDSSDVPSTVVWEKGMVRASRGVTIRPPPTCASMGVQEVGGAAAGRGAARSRRQQAAGTGHDGQQRGEDHNELNRLPRPPPAWPHPEEPAGHARHRARGHQGCCFGRAGEGERIQS